MSRETATAESAAAWRGYHPDLTDRRPATRAFLFSEQALSNARAELFAAFHAGELVASGQQDPDDRWPREEIPMVFWSRALTCTINQGRMDVWGSHDGRGTRWHDVIVSGKAVLRLWPPVTVPAGRPRGRKPDAVWTEIEREVFTWLDHEGGMPQANIERHIVDLLAERGEERAESTVREYAKKYIQTFSEYAKSGGRL